MDTTIVFNIFDINYEIIKHEISGKTTFDAVKALSLESKYIVKSLLFKTEKDEFFGIIIRGDKKFSVRKIKLFLSQFSKINSNKFSLASEKDVYEILGYNIGGVPVTAFYKVCFVICDYSLLDVDFIIGAGGNEYTGIKINPNCLKKIYFNWGYISEN
jgi:prolyl-tRNA editing enzyme YbaK/EbsC (Cys-tRNA(Pro) deacylase)